jgi:hypothetical protein
MHLREQGCEYAGVDLVSSGEDTMVDSSEDCCLPGIFYRVAEHD